MTASVGELRPSFPVDLGRAMRIAIAMALVALTVARVVDVVTERTPASSPTPVPADEAMTGLATLPMAWVQNAGQTDPAVRYLAQGLGYAAFLTDTEAVIRLDGAVVRAGFAGASTTPEVTTEEPLDAIVSTFAGSDPAGWSSAAPTAEIVRYEQLWPGIDATFRGSGTHLEWDYHLAAGADPTDAAITLDGAEEITIDGETATLTIGDDHLTLGIPALWQTRADGTRIDRQATWQRDGTTLRVKPDAWEPELPGTIDPTLDWSTYLGGGPGGSGEDRGAAIAADAEGNTYVTGYTRSVDFPATVGALDESYACCEEDTASADCCQEDVFVTKLDPTGSSLVFSTFLGSTAHDKGTGIAVGSDGDVYVVGQAAAGFPVTPGAFTTTVGTSLYPFVARLDASGGSLEYSTFLGGTAFGSAAAVAVDATGAAYVTGYAVASGFPTTPGAYDTTYAGANDGFAVKLVPDGSALAYGTYLGGPFTDEPQAIAIGDGGTAHVVGQTSGMFPTTAGAYDTTANGSFDAFALKLDATGATLGYSTYLGGASADSATGVAVDAAGTAYLAGSTGSTGFPATPGAYDTSHNGSTDLFALTVDAAGAALGYSTFLGSSGGERSDGIAVDDDGSAYVMGTTPDVATDYPTTPGAYDTTHNGATDLLVTKLEPAGDALAYSTLIGGSGSEIGGDILGGGIALDGANAVHVIGDYTNSTDFPQTPSAYDDGPGEHEEVPIAKIDASGASLVYSTVLGGTEGVADGRVEGVAADLSGVYVTGNALSSQFPTTAGAFDTVLDGGDDVDVYVAKLSPSGDSLLYSTLLGSDGFQLAGDIGVDAGGNAYVVGETREGTYPFPTTAGAYDTTASDIDAFVTKLNPSGSALVFSTFYDSFVPYGATDLDVGPDGSPYFTLPGSYGSQATLVRLDATGSTRIFEALLGGSLTDMADAVSVDGTGAAYLAGRTWSPNFPTTPGAYDTTFVGGYDPGDEEDLPDAFVAKLTPAGAVTYSTFLGAYGNEYPADIEVDPNGQASVMGSTSSNLFPVTSGAFDSTDHTGYDSNVFVSRLDPQGRSLLYSALIGGTGEDGGNGIELDASGGAIVAGSSSVGGAVAFPVTPDAYDGTANGGLDAFVTRLNPYGTALTYSTLLGSAGDDWARGIAATVDGRVAIAGATDSASFPVTAGAFDESNIHNLDAGFISVLDLSLPATGGCKNSTTPAAEIGMYPASPGSQSGLRVSCRWDTELGESAAPASFTVHDFDVATYHNGSARSVTNSAAIAAGATTFTLTSYAATSAWVNRPITAVGVTGLTPRTFVRSISGTGLVTLNQPTTAAIPTGTTFLIDNSSARSITDGATTSSSTTVTSATANFTAADVGVSVSGTNLPTGTTITSVSNATTATLSNAATASGGAQTLALGETLVATTTRTVNDAANTSTTQIRSPAAKFKADDIGLRVSGPGIPTHTYITAVNGTGLVATTTGGLTVTTAPQTVVIGEPSATAPAGTDVVATIGLQLDLDPIVVLDSDPCSEDTPESLVYVGQWRNPGAFVGGSRAVTQPAGTKAIGEIFFDGPRDDFAAFVVERRALTAGDPNGAAHYDLMFPFVPITTAACSSPTSPGVSLSLGIHAQTASQGTLGFGTGKPGTAQLRSITSAATGGYLSSAFVTSNDPALTMTPAPEFTRLCTYPAGPAPVGFRCGNG